MTSKYDERMRIHESGHVTFYSAVKYEIEGVTKYPRTIRGVTYPAHVKLLRRPKHNLHTLIGNLAGLAAERVILGVKYPANFESPDILSARQKRFAWASIRRVRQSNLPGRARVGIDTEAM